MKQFSHGYGGRIILMIDAKGREAAAIETAETLILPETPPTFTPLVYAMARTVSTGRCGDWRRPPSVPRRDALQFGVENMLRQGSLQIVKQTIFGKHLARIAAGQKQVEEFFSIAMR